MISKCPFCNKDISLSDAQKAKLKNAFAALKPGQSIKFKCTNCGKNIEMTSGQKKAPAPENNNNNAQPSIGKEDTSASTPPKTNAAPNKNKDSDMPKPINPPPDPPKPTDISWLSSGAIAEKEIITDIPTAIILMLDGPERNAVGNAFSSLNYQLYFPKTVTEAMDRMRFKDFAAAVFQTEFEEGKLKDSKFHTYIRSMSMTKRRYIYYVLIGSDFHTLYDLEALAYSANLVINTSEIGKIDIIIKKGIADYDMIFNPLIKILKSYGKR